jgi:DNA-binding response OmpR family regulator
MQTQATGHRHAVHSTANAAARPRTRGAAAARRAVRALLAEWLRRAGFEPVRCTPGAPAQDVVLVVADVCAPRQGGGACIAALRHSFPHARVLAVSAQFTLGMHGATTAAVELGADAVLAKPFAAKVFIDAVQTALFQLS